MATLTLLFLFAFCIASSDTVLGQGCQQCVVESQKIQGNSYFTYNKKCVEYKNCKCNCNGSWNCPAENAVDHCRQNVSIGCSFCNVRGQRFSGNSNFKFRDGCNEFNCFCKCDGGWNCPSEKTINICNTNINTGCKYCDVNGQKHEGNSYFTHRKECVEYKNCMCNCDGSWNCPGENAIDYCRQNVNTGCYYCTIDKMKIEGNSRFHLVRDCYQYSGCICQCDGGWTCAHTTGRYVCGTKRGKVRYSSTKVSSVQKITSSQGSYQKSSEE
ncbi:hypothetical protein CHS0354_037191 [Potamilus streckersoni]|uniref:Uncharacterized protein n=1 Tax=Potamilus streckersoni TaxID=2493646 RepID=A0AAE0SXI0_9BIVA|nr:hypothetical protein CHS0354_037191 [Potamilus streckersoni]